MFGREYKCSNCGKNAHNYKQCNEPVTSFGIILFRLNNPTWNQSEEICKSDTTINGYETDKLEYLLIQRRDSLGYIEVLRGKYKMNDEEYILKQINGMTNEERVKICTMQFDTLWTSLWQNGNIPIHYHKNEQESARMKFNELRTSGIFDKLCKEATIEWPTPEWGFPKGRRDSRESDLECAIRELWEETGVTRNEIKIIENIEPFQETFLGTNSIHYCHKYFLGYCKYNEKHSKLYNSSNPHIAREIGNIQWFSLEESLDHIRPDNIEKREIIKRVDFFLRNTSPLIGNE
jgi:8-oxo-dGTP pyrophosphatase MutT (NUDIX family)